MPETEEVGRLENVQAAGRLAVAFGDEDLGIGIGGADGIHHVPPVAFSDRCRGAPAGQIRDREALRQAEQRVLVGHSRAPDHRLAHRLDHTEEQSVT